MKIYRSQFWRLESPKSRYQQIWGSVEGLLLMGGDFCLL
jgi:hypothetical protein